MKDQAAFVFYTECDALRLLHLFQSLLKIGQQIIHMLDAN